MRTYRKFSLKINNHYIFIKKKKYSIIDRDCPSRLLLFWTGALLIGPTVNKNDLLLLDKIKQNFNFPPIAMANEF